MESEYHGAYVTGYTDGTFGPDRDMTRSEAATIFARLLAPVSYTHLDVYKRQGNNRRLQQYFGPGRAPDGQAGLRERQLLSY